MFGCCGWDRPNATTNHFELKISHLQYGNSQPAAQVWSNIKAWAWISRGPQLLWDHRGRLQLSELWLGAFAPLTLTTWWNHVRCKSMLRYLGKPLPRGWWLQCYQSSSAARTPGGKGRHSKHSSTVPDPQIWARKKENGWTSVQALLGIVSCCLCATYKRHLISSQRH